jgi:hypothetical protein
MNYFALLVISILLLGCGGSGSNGSNGSVEKALSWTVPTQRVNGDALLLNDIKGYRFCYSKDGGAELCSDFDIATPGQSSYSISDLASGDYEITLATIDINNIYSDKSASLSYKVD